MPATSGDSVIIQIISGSIFINRFEYYTTPFNNYQDLLIEHIDSLANLKVNEMNSVINQRQMLWSSGKNSFSSFPYEVKKSFYGEKYNIEGLDYYNGGIYVKMSQISNANKFSDTLIEYFDWRKKHNANISSSLYFDNDPDSMYFWYYDTLGNPQITWLREHGNGWLTGIQDQGRWGNCPYGCYAFAPIASVEAVINLYFNKHLNYDLSEQEAISCGHDILSAGYCWEHYGGNPITIARYIRDYGISEEGCFNWADNMDPCTNKCSTPNYILKISNYNSFSPPTISLQADKIRLKQEIINYGPHATTVGENTGHAMVLVGWGKIREGQILKRQWDVVTVNSGNPLIGANYWILKNSGGSMSGDQGYSAYIDTYDVNTRLSSVFRIVPPITGINDTIRCVDLDGDGYYNWGISSTKPATCPTCPDEEDCNDNDPLMGPYDGNYYCTCNCASFAYSATPLQITQNEIWQDYKYINKDVVVTSGDTLTIQAKIGFHKDAKIIVENGGTLILSDGCLLTSICDTTWKGIVVNGGGKLITNNRSEVILAANNKIFIDKDASGSGEFYFNKGSNIVLEDDSSYINIKGELYIGDSANFSFIGNGFLKLSNTSTTSENIIAGNGVSINLEGTSQTDKVLEIDQETFYVPQNIINFDLTNGFVYMKSSTARLSFQGQTNINIDNVKFTPNVTSRTGHRGLMLYGQTNCIINNCWFEYGDFGINGYLDYGTSLSVTNCTFFNNVKALWTHGKALLASYCTFTKNDYAYYAEYTSLETSLIDHCTFSAAPNGNKYPVRYINCDHNIMMQYSQINWALATAIYATGGHDFNLLCSSISGIAGGGYAVNLENGPRLNMGLSTETTGYNYIYALNPIRLTNANWINVDRGYNYLNKSTGTYNIYGSISKYACLVQTPTIYARNNQWVPSISNNYLKKYNCTPIEIYTLVSTSPITYSSCENESMMAQDTNGTEIQSINENYSSGLYEQQNAEIISNGDVPLNIYYQVFNEQVPAYTIANVDLWENTWENMRHCIKEMYTTKQLTGTNNSDFTKTISANDKMRQLQSSNYFRKFQLELEKATLYRMAGDYNTAISLLTPLTADTSTINSKQAEAWLCIVMLEKQIAEGAIKMNEIEEARKECPMWEEEMGSSSLKLSNNNTENTNEINSNVSWLNIMPNPTGENAVLCVNAVSDVSCVVEITDMFGKLIKMVKVEAGYTETPVTFTEFAEGIYIVTLKKNGVTIATNRVTITK